MRQAELAAVAIANRAAIIPLIPNVLAELPAQLEAAAHRDACAAFVRDYHMVGLPSVSLAFLGEGSEGSLVGTPVKMCAAFVRDYHMEGLLYVRLPFRWGGSLTGTH